MVKMMIFRNQIWSSRKESAKRPDQDLEGKMNIISFFDDNNDGEMSCKNQIWSGRKGGAKRPGPDLEGKVNIISFFDDNDDGEDDELQKPDLEW